MTPDPRTTRPVGDTLEGQETPSYEDVACFLREGSGRVISPPHDDMVPNTFDILCGRDKVAYGNFGNRSFRETIATHRNRYQNARSRNEKTRITDGIVALVRECGGRFLMKDENTNLWKEVGNKYAHDKVSHALRSAKDHQKKFPGRERKVRHQHPTAEETHAFQTLLIEQHRILSSLLEGKHDF